MKVPLVYQCPRCRQTVRLFITPSEPPTCSHEPGCGFKTEAMRLVKAKS